MQWEGETEYTCYHYNKKKLKAKYVRIRKNFRETKNSHVTKDVEEMKEDRDIR